MSLNQVKPNPAKTEFIWLSTLQACAKVDMEMKAASLLSWKTQRIIRNLNWSASGWRNTDGGACRLFVLVLLWPGVSDQSHTTKFIVERCFNYCSFWHVWTSVKLSCNAMVQYCPVMQACWSFWVWQLKSILNCATQIIANLLKFSRYVLQCMLR